MTRSNIATLMRLEENARNGSLKAVGWKVHAKRAFNIFGSLTIFALYNAMVYYITKMFTASLGFEYLVLMSFIYILAGSIISTGSMIKNLYAKGDNELLLRFPVNGMEIFVAKSFYAFLKNILISLLMLFPIFLMFGVLSPLVTAATSAQQAGYYIVMILLIPMMSLIPFAIANIFAIPAMTIANFVKNKFFIVLVILIGFLCGGFVLYMEILGKILKYMQGNNITFFSPKIVMGLQQFSLNAYPFRFYSDVLLGTIGQKSALVAGLSFLGIFAITVALLALGLYISKVSYYKTILNGIEAGKATLNKKRRYTKRPTFNTLLRKEWLLIFRSFNYSFQYLAMAIAAPLMVFYCDKLAIGYGKSSLGSLIIPGMTLTIIILFTTVIVSFASTTISREGDCFYQTKIIPVSYRKQVLVKLFLYSIVGTISAFACCFVVGMAYGKPSNINVVTSNDMFSIFIIAELILLGLTCLSIKIDIKSPTFNVAGDGEMVSINKNVAFIVLLGIVIAVSMGFFCIIYVFKPLQIGNWTLIGTKNTMSQIYGWLIGFSALFFIITASTLFPSISKDYKKLVP